jgi:EAL domain-containing protein (putative c-di-GMP-specific phosphodiesterase class I)
MAENLGLIGELGHLVRRLAFQQFQAWRRVHPELTLSINISKRQLFASNFMEMLMADLASYGLTPEALVIKVTESVALMDVEFAEERLRQFAAAGFTLSLDDFGTGYASLSQLHELPIGELKIDISFVRRIHTPEGLRLTQGIVSLAQALGLRTVAEGVEDEATAQTLRELGVNVLQGYHFGRPCPASEFAALPLFTHQAGLPQG